MKITVKVIPRSSKLSVEQLDDTSYKVKLTAPPADNEANFQLIQVLADHFKIPKSRISIYKGSTSKNKIVEIEEA
ncbi:MAG: DUF167 domain-containing protein [bacterium]